MSIHTYKSKEPFKELSSYYFNKELTKHLFQSKKQVKAFLIYSLKHIKHIEGNITGRIPSYSLYTPLLSFYEEIPCNYK